MIPLHHVWSVGFLEFFFLFFFCYFNVFCRLGRLALSRSNNMAECFDKNSGASVRFFKNLSGGHGKSAEPEPARPMGAHTGPFTDISCAAAVSSLLSVFEAAGESSSGDSLCSKTWVGSERRSFSRDGRLSLLLRPSGLFPGT